MATDATRTVNIAINVVGNVATKFTAISNGLTALVAPLAAINKDIGTAATGLDKFAKSFATITTPPDLSGFSKEVAKLSAIDSSGLTAFVESAKGLKVLGVSASFTTMVDGLERLVGIKDLPDLKAFAASVTALKKALVGMSVSGLTKLGEALELFSGRSMPTGTKLVGFAAALTDLSKADLKNVSSTKLTSIATALTAFSGIGTLPSGTTFTTFATALKNLSTFTITATQVTNLKALAAVLPQFVGTATGLPTKAKLAGFVAGMKSLAGINVSGINAGKLVSVSASIRAFVGIGTLPDLSKFSAGISALGKIDTSGIAKILPAIKSLVTGLQGLAAVTPVLKVFISLTSALGTASPKLTKVGKGLEDVGVAGKKAKSGVQEAADALGNLKTKSTGAIGALKKLKSAVNNYVKYRAIADSVIALKEAVFGGITSIIEYDQALKDLQAITGATGLEVEQMGEKIIQVAQDTKFSASEVAAGMRTLGQAGFSAGESVQAMEAISNLATGTLSEMSATVDLVSTALRVFRLDASETARVSDVFANAVNRSKLTTDKLRISMNYVGPVARDMGLSIEEMSAAMMTLANSGLRASTIGTGLRRVLAELANPSDKLAAAAQNAGISLEDLNPLTNDFSEVIRNLGLVITDTGTAFDLFGKRGAAAVLALSSEGNSFDEMLASAQTSGTAAEMAGIQIEGLGVSIKNLKDTFGVLAISMGKGGFAAGLKLVVDGLKAVVDGLITFSDAGGGFITKTVAMVAALTLLAATIMAVKTTAFGAFIVSIGANIGTVTTAIVSGMAAIRTAVISVTAEYVLAADAAAFFGTVSGFGVILAGLAALTAVVVGVKVAYDAAYKSSKELSDAAAKDADKYEQNIKTIDNYNVAIAGMTQASKEQQVENLKLKESLVAVAKGGGDLASFAYEAASGINALNGEMSDTSALDRYYEKAKKLETLKIAEAFTEGFKAIKEGLEDETGVIKIKGIEIGDASNTKAAIFGKQFADGKKSWEEFREFSIQLMNELPEELKPAEKAILDGFNSATELSQKALEKMGLAGKDAANVTATQMLIAAEKMHLISDTGSDAAKALTYEFNKVKDSLSFTNIIGKWQEENEKIPPGVDQIAQAYDTLGVAISDVDKKTADGLLSLKKYLVEAQKDLELGRTTDLAETDDYEERLAISRKYDVKEAQLRESAAALNKAISENEVVQNTQKFAQLAAVRDKALAANEAKNGEAAGKDAARLAAFVETETSINKAFSDGMDKILGTSTSTKEALVAGTVANTAVEKQLKDALYAIEVAEGSGVLTHEKAEEAKLATSVDYYNKLAAQARAKLAEIEGLEGTADPADLAKAVKTAEDYEQKVADAKLAVLAKYGDDVVKLNEDISNGKDNADKEEIKNTKILAAAKKKYSDDEVKYRAKADKAIAKSSDTYDKAIAKSKEKMWDTLEDLAQDYKDAQIDRDSTVAENARTLEDDVNTIRRRGMTDEEKSSNDRLQASKKYAAAMSLIAEANSANNAVDRAAGAEKLKLAGQLLDDSKALSANDADDGFALSGVYKVAAAKDKAAQAQLVLDKKNNDALIAEAKAKQVAEAAQAKKIRDTALKSIADILVEELKGISTTLEAALVAEDTRHDAVMKNIKIEDKERKRLLGVALKGQSDALEDINNPKPVTTGSTSTTGSTTNQGQGKVTTTGVSDVLSGTAALAKELGMEIETSVGGALVSASNKGKEGFAEFFMATTADGKQMIVTAKELAAGFGAFGKIVSSEPLAAVKKLKDATDAIVAPVVEDTTKTVNIETADAVTKVRALSKEFFTLYNESTDKDGVHTVLAEGTEGAQKLNDKLAEVSKQFEIMGTTSGDQNLQDKVNFLNAMSDAGVDATDAYIGLIKELDNVENRQLQIDPSGVYTVIDDLGNKVKGVKEDFQSNPITIGAELGVSGVNTLRALGELKGLTNSFTSAIKLKVDLKNAATQQLEDINKQIELLDDKEIEILAELDDGEVSAELARIEETRARLEAKATEIQVTLDAAQAKEDLDAIAEAKAKLDARAEQIQIQVGVADKASTELKEIEQLQALLDKKEVEIKATLADGEVSADLARIEEARAKLDARETELKIVINGSTDAKAKLDEIDILSEKLDAKESEIRLKVDSQGTADTINNVNAGIDSVQQNAEEPIVMKLSTVDNGAAADIQAIEDTEIVAEIAVEADTANVKNDLKGVSDIEIDPIVIPFEGTGSPTLPIHEQIDSVTTSINAIGNDIQPIVLDLDDSAINDIIVKFAKGVQLPATVEIEIEDNNDVMDLLNLLAGDDGLSTEVSATTTSETKEDMGVLQTFINELMDNPLVFAITLEVDKALTAIKSLLKEIDKLEDKVITITTKSSGSSSSNYADGGEVFNKLTSPFITQGGGNVDDVPAMLMRGEFVFTQKAVKKYGLELLQAMNSGMLNLDKLIPKAYAGGGMVEPQNFAGGGGVGFLSSMSGFTLPSFSVGGMVNSVGASTNSTASTGSMVNIKLDLPVTGTPVSIQADRWNANELVSQLMKLKRSSA